VFIEGEYKAQGKIIHFTLGGKGVYNISMSKDGVIPNAPLVVTVVQHGTFA
jgi:hypothetical protein